MKFRSLVLHGCIIFLMTGSRLSASSFTNWTEYPGNPIYTPYPLSTALYDDYVPCVLYNADKFNADGDHVFYKMWHQGSGIATGTLALSTSNDGIHWTLKGDTNLVAPPGKDIGHPCVLYDKGGFGGGVYSYKMWFWDGFPDSISDIQYSVSADGFFWEPPIPITQEESAKLVDGVQGSYFYQTDGPGFVIYNPAATINSTNPYSFPYVMFYDAVAAGYVPENPEIASIAIAYSQNGKNWERFGSKPLLMPSGNGSEWDGFYNSRPTVFKAEGTFHMFYSGSNGNPLTGTYFAHGLGTASSSDGISWVKDSANPIFINTDGVSWRTDRTYTPCVLVDPKIFGDPSPAVLKMWFVGGNQPYTLGQAIGYATLPHPFIPQPPQNLRGELKRDRNNFILTIKWQPSPSAYVVLYNIYEDGHLIQTTSNKKRKFKGKIHSTKNLRQRFTVTSVTSDGFESQPARLTKIKKQ